MLSSSSAAEQIAPQLFFHALPVRPVTARYNRLSDIETVGVPTHDRQQPATEYASCFARNTPVLLRIIRPDGRVCEAGKTRFMTPEDDLFFSVPSKLNGNAKRWTAVLFAVTKTAQWIRMAHDRLFLRQGFTLNGPLLTRSHPGAFVGPQAAGDSGAEPRLRAHSATLPKYGSACCPIRAMASSTAARTLGSALLKSSSGGLSRLFTYSSAESSAMPGGGSATYHQ